MDKRTSNNLSCRRKCAAPPF